MKSICFKIITCVVFCIFSCTSLLHAEIINADFSQLEEAENLWDGVNRAKQLQVNTRSMSILVSGDREQAKPFGACPRVGDIDGDGADELLVADAFGFLWKYEIGKARKGRTISPGTFYHTYFGDTPAPSLYDWNGDGTLDVLVGNNMGTIAFVKNRGESVLVERDFVPSFLNHENGEYSEELHFPLVKSGTEIIDIGNFAAPYIYDWNGDGKQDMLLGEGSYSANSIYLFINIASKANPDFNFDQRNWLAYGMGREQLVPTLGDLDGDGDKDLVVGEREGYITFYRNEPYQTQDKKERYLIPFVEEITFDSITQPIGGMVRPELTDWDGDGDLDLLLGAQDGRVYYAENTGTKQKYAFGMPVPLVVTEDKEKPYKRPVSWNIDYIWFKVESRFNSGARMRYVKETNEEGIEDSFVRIEYVDGYVGKIQRLMSGGRTPLSYSEEHELVIECRGKNIKRLNVELEHYENAKINETTRKEAWPRVNIDITDDVSPAWKKIKKTFSFEPDFEQNKGKKADKWFRIQFEGTSDMTFDIKSVTIQ